MSPPGSACVLLRPTWREDASRSPSLACGVGGPSLGPDHPVNMSRSCPSSVRCRHLCPLVLLVGEHPRTGFGLFGSLVPGPGTGPGTGWIPFHVSWLNQSPLVVVCFLASGSAAPLSLEDVLHPPDTPHSESSSGALSSKPELPKLVDLGTLLTGLGAIPFSAVPRQRDFTVGPVLSSGAAGPVNSRTGPPDPRPFSSLLLQVDPHV